MANLVVWTKTFEANRESVVGAGMLGVRGYIQRECEALHLAAHPFSDSS
ncbi:hypothetical protein GGQ76_004019 [Aureimonas jatrophae]|uniref:DNA polymerase-3 subunit alpha/error-prone DNA polymerase n=1 Tax=Aureimonas jatrophae TaxID=1166073 RepID=A0A1H0LRD2_9HYPH|nr:hypothetical protein [Aureimonas jatrophae]SDO70601.1 DNA polymerase-3 subunit alpha/error-prone DNA polymerase [Aureimonas jatrophae]